MTGEGHWHDRDGPCEQCDKNWKQVVELEKELELERNEKEVHLSAAQRLFRRVEQLLKERGPCDWGTDYDETTGKSYIYCMVHDDESKQELCLELRREAGVR